MLDEVLGVLRPAAGEIAVDATLGGGGHAHAILSRLQPGGRLLGLDVDPLVLPRTAAELRASGFGPESFLCRHASFAELQQLLTTEGIERADIILADLGVSAMQHDDPARGFSYKGVGPLDMRMDPQRGEPASRLIARVGEDELAALLRENADEPHSEPIARVLKGNLPGTTHAAAQVVRAALSAAAPELSKAELKLSVRRTFQALRIAVNDEFRALEALLTSLPRCLAPGGRVAVLTFHSGEDRRVKKAFQAGLRSGVYAEIARSPLRSQKAETFDNRRAAAAKLRWAVRGDRPGN